MTGSTPARRPHPGAIVFWSLVGALALGVGAFVGTRVLAATFAPAMGIEPLGGSAGRWYAPEDGWRMTGAAFARFPAEVAFGWAMGLVASAGIFALAGLLRRRRRRGWHDASESHGSARWATREDIVAAGLIGGPTSERSLIVGGWCAPGAPPSAHTEYLTHTGPESLWAFAPSRSGKTSGLVVPNLLCYESSAFALDLRGDLWDTSAGYRRDVLGQHVLFHDPGSTDSGNARFNPLEEIDIGLPTAVRDVQMLLEYLVPGSERRHSASHFDDSARALGVGIFLHEIARASLRGGPPATVAGVLSEIASPLRSIREYLRELTEFELAGLERVARVVRETAAEMLERDEREFSGVRSSLVTPLAKFRDPILADATSRSDFRLLDLVTHERPVTLYLTIRPADRERLKHYVALVVSLICRRLTDTLTRDAHARRELLLLLDEFSSLPPLPVVQQSMDVMAGYGIKAFVVLQDYESLLALYGEHETFSSNAKVLVAFTPSKPKTARFLSERLGPATARQETAGSQHRPLSLLPTGVSEGEGYHARPLLTPDEVMRLGVARVDEHYRLVEPGEALVFVRGSRPIRGVMTPWFLDPELAERSACLPPPVSDRLHAPLEYETGAEPLVWEGTETLVGDDAPLARG